MKLGFRVNGTEDSIEILAPAPSCRFQIGGHVREAQVEAPERGVYSVLLEGRSYEVRVEDSPEGGGVVVVIDGYRFEVDVRDPRRWSRKSAGAGEAGMQRITAPMPGKVVRVLVSHGDEVAAGQGLVVVEAMKMQNELKARRAGKVATVAAREGATVTAGEVLVTIE